MKNLDVIVIGAGNGGLATAASLSIEDKDVLVFEKHNIPGGCGTSFCRGRFEFEVALHQLSHMGTPDNPGPLRELFELYGFENDIDWIEIDTLFKVNLPDGRGVALPADRKKAEATLIKAFPHERKNVLAYFETVYQFAEESDAFLAQTKASTGDPTNLQKMMVKLGFAKKYPVLAKYGLRSTQEVLDEFFDTPEIQLCLSAYWCFMGMPPERFPFSILARCTHIYIEHKPAFLRGGSQVMSQALTETIHKHGNQVKFNCGVERILVEDGKAVGVIDEEGNQYRAKKIISNISPLVTYGELMKDQEIPQEILDYFKAYTVGISALTCFIGLDCPPEEIGFTDSFNLIYDSLDANEDFKGAYGLTTDHDPIIATNYTVDDPIISPEGTSLITAGTLKYAGAWEELSPEAYYETKYKAAQTIMDRLEERYPGIKDHVEEFEVATPLTHMRYLGHPGGAIYGFEQDVRSSVFFYPQDTFIENLDFASGWVNVCGFGPNYLYGHDMAKKIAKEV